MLIGATFGISAATLLAMYAYDKESFSDSDNFKTYLDALGILKNSADSSLIYNERLELLCFQKRLENLPTKVVGGNRHKLSYDVFKGVVIDEDEELSSDAMRAVFDDTVEELKFATIEALLKKDDDTKVISSLFMISDDAFTKIIKDWLKANKFRYTKQSSAVKQIVSTFLLEDGFNNIADCKAGLLKTFGLTECLDFTAGVDENSRKVIQYFYDRRDWVPEILDQISAIQASEINVFGIPFSRLLSRDPRSVLYCCKEQLKPIETTASREAVMTYINKFQSDLQKIKDLLKSEVSVISDKTNDVIAKASDLMTQHKVNELLATDVAAKTFFTKLIDNEVINLCRVTEADFIKLVKLFHMIAEFDISKMNEIFDTNFDVKDINAFNQECSNLNEYGVGGLNAAGLDLFYNSFTSLTFSANEKIYRTQEHIAAFLKNIDVIQELSDSLLPLGAPIKTDIEE